MPSWNIHLEAGNRLAKKLNFSPEKRKEFFLGCILPDLNNGYVNNAKIVKEHDETHYAFDEKSSLNFYAENQKQIDAKNPIFLGFLFHLFADGYFNYNFYRTIKHHAEYKNLAEDEQKKIKHHDFWIYDTKYYYFIGIKDENDAEKLVKLANEIPTVEISKTELLEVEDILKTRILSLSVKDKNYLYYSETALDDLLDEMINNFSNQYLGENHA